MITLLLVDDEHDIVNIFKEGLESGGKNNGLVVHAFTDPVMALENFQKNPQGYAMVISDIRMPGMTGFQLVREIKKLNPGIIVILMTAFEMDRSEFAKELVFAEVHFIQKPIRIPELRDVILKYLADATMLKEGSEKR